MLDKPIDQLLWSDLEALLSGKRSEDRQLEFKRALPGGKDAEAREFLADVTSFANTDGGDIIFGVEAKDGVATQLLPIPIETIDTALLRLENLLRTATDPRLSTTRFVTVADDAGGALIILRIPASFAAPHRINHQGVTRFLARNSRGKFDMDAHQLRAAFAATDALPKALRALHEGAINAASGQNMPFRLPLVPTAIVTVAPLSVLRERHDIATNHETAFYPPRISGSIDWAVALEGFIVHSPINAEGEVRTYAINHRRGYIDMAWAIGDDLRGEPLVWPVHFKLLVGHVLTAVGRLQSNGLSGPWVAMTTLAGLRGYRIVFDQHENSNPAFRDHAYLGEIVADSIAEESLAPFLDGFYRLFGIAR